MSSLSQLGEAHRQEWKTFFSTQVESRHSLGERHKNERMEKQGNTNEYAKTVLRQGCEQMEFRAVYDDLRWRLQNKHNQEILSLS